MVTTINANIQQDMKKINKIFSLLIGFATLMMACDSIVDEKHLENSATVETVELLATQSTTGGNEIEFNMLTPGVTGYWDYLIGKELASRFTVTFPVAGTFDFKYVGTLGAEFFEKSTSVTIDTLDHEVPAEWSALLGEDAVAGKTWVFDGGPHPDRRRWWYMSPPNDPMAWANALWNAAGDCCPPVDASGKMHFDLDGATNFTYYSGPNASPVKGSFVLDLANQTLQINGANILGAEEPRGNPDGLYQIISLTENKLVLYLAFNADETGWTWVFRPELNGTGRR